MEKIQSNQARDARNIAALESQGWTVLELWECEIRRFTGLEEKLRKFLSD